MISPKEWVWSKLSIQFNQAQQKLAECYDHFKSQPNVWFDFHETNPLLPQLNDAPDHPRQIHKKRVEPIEMRLPQSQVSLRLKWIDIVLETARKKNQIGANKRVPILKALATSSCQHPPHTILDIDAELKSPEHYLSRLEPVIVTLGEHKRAIAPRLVHASNIQTNALFSTQRIEYQPMLAFRHDSSQQASTIRQLEIVHFHFLNPKHQKTENPLFFSLEVLSGAIKTLQDQQKALWLCADELNHEGQMLVFYHLLRHQLIAPGRHFETEDFFKAFDAAVIDLRLRTHHNLNHIAFYKTLLTKLYQELQTHHLLLTDSVSS